MHELIEECLTIMFDKYTIIEPSVDTMFDPKISYRVYNVSDTGVNIIGTFTVYQDHCVLLDMFYEHFHADDHYFLYHDEYAVLLRERRFLWIVSYEIYCYKKLDIETIHNDGIKIKFINLNDTEILNVEQWNNNVIYFKNLDNYNALVLFLTSLDLKNALIRFESFLFLRKIG